MLIEFARTWQKWVTWPLLPARKPWQTFQRLLETSTSSSAGPFYSYQLFQHRDLGIWSPVVQINLPRVSTCPKEDQQLMVGRQICETKLVKSFEPNWRGINNTIVMFGCSKMSSVDHTCQKNLQQACRPLSSTELFALAAQTFTRTFQVLCIFLCFECKKRASNFFVSFFHMLVSRESTARGES